ncbi:MAG: hypothetical protein KIS96_13160 [Bauldia sp.]|nr:hypothetical protein [Bauldia sp.]
MRHHGLTGRLIAHGIEGHHAGLADSLFGPGRSASMVSTLSAARRGA